MAEENSAMQIPSADDQHPVADAVQETQQTREEVSETKDNTDNQQAADKLENQANASTGNATNAAVNGTALKAGSSRGNSNANLSAVPISNKSKSQSGSIGNHIGASGVTEKGEAPANSKRGSHDDIDFSTENIKQPRNRIFGEEDGFLFNQVDRLSQLCLNSLVKTFEERPVLNRCPAKLAKRLVDILPITLSLEVAEKHIDTESYWEKRCRAHFHILDPTTKKNKSFKTIYFEKLVQLEIESFTPRRLVLNGDYASDTPLLGSTNWSLQQQNNSKKGVSKEITRVIPGINDFTMSAGGAIDAISDYSTRSLVGGGTAAKSGSLLNLQKADTRLNPSYFTAYSQLIPLLQLASTHVNDLEIRQLRPFIPYTVEEEAVSEDIANLNAQLQAAALDSTIKRLAVSKSTASANAPVQPIISKPSVFGTSGSAQNSSKAIDKLGNIQVVQERSPWVFYDRYRKAIHPIDLTGVEYKRTDPKPTHFDFQVAFMYLQKLSKLRVYYGARNMGLYAHSQLFGASSHDVQNLANCFKPNPAIRLLDLTGSKLSAAMVVQLTEALLTNTNLQHLCLNQNTVGQEGALALAHLLSKPSNIIETLQLSDTDIDYTGAIALVQAIVDCSSTCTSLDLSLNKKIGDFGCKTILELLSKASSQRKSSTSLPLKKINLAATRCGIETALALSGFLNGNFHNPVDINLSCNNISQVVKDSYSFASETPENVQRQLVQQLQKLSSQKKKKTLTEQELLSTSTKPANHIIGQLLLQSMQSNKHVCNISLLETNLAPDVINLVSSFARTYHPSKAI